MRILIQTLGSAGDVHPFIPIGRMLKAMGHDVSVWGNEMFEALITGAGLDFRESGSRSGFEAAMGDADLWHPRRGLRVIMGRAVVAGLEDTVTSMLREVRGGDTLVVGSTLGLAARMVRDIANVPMASVHLAPCVFRSNLRAPRFSGMWAPDWTPRWFKQGWWWLSDRVIDPMIAPALNDLGARHGLAPIRGVFGDWGHSPDRIVALFPDWFGPPQPDWPAHVETTGFPLFDQGDERETDVDLERWIDAGDAPIVVTAGSANIHGEDFYAASMDACRRLGRRALIVTGNRALLPDALPDGVRCVSYVPFSHVLPKAAALVSHAGIGTCAQALSAGIPHLGRPMAFDQFDNASRLEDLGVGACLPASRYTARRAATLLGALLARTSVGHACRDAAERMRAADDVLQQTCNFIESTPSAS